MAVIKSQAGLQSVTMKLQTVEGVTEYKTVTEFFNPNSYSLSENLEYNANYEAFIIEATDKLNHVTSGTLPIAVTDVMARPSINKVYILRIIISSYGQLQVEPMFVLTMLKGENGLMTMSVWKNPWQAAVGKILVNQTGSNGKSPQRQAKTSNILPKNGVIHIFENYCKYSK